MSDNILPEPSEELKLLSHALCKRVREKFGTDGMMPFSRFMEMALYEPGLGYYSAGLHKLGASGDFVTAPELGALFATCLARQVNEVASTLGEYDILEAGAGTGRLAVDLFAALDPKNLPRRYWILERSADLRKVQLETIVMAAPGLLDRVEWLEQPPATGWQGVFIANEVLDALAVERFKIGKHGVEQMCVTEKEGRFTWTSREAPAELKQAVAHIEAETRIEFPRGYQSEINLLTADWLDAVTSQMTKGLALFFDYGYPRREYYLAERSDGTLMCHYRHRAHDDVFFWPALQDITSWVDFTALAEAADKCDLDVEGYTSQSMFLLGCGLDQILAQQNPLSEDGGLALSAQVRQLTLPGMMGEKFKVMGLGRGLEHPLGGFSLQDLRYKL